MARTGLLRSRLARAGIAVAVTVALAACELPADTVEDDFDLAAQRLTAATGRLAPTAYPFYTGASGAWVTGTRSHWTSGFFPGLLWQMYERTGDASWRTRAQSWQAAVEAQKADNTTHDIGFQLLSTFGNGYRLTGEDAYRQVLLTGAGTLATRYNPTVGAVRSWDARSDTTRYRVIVDNMMNIELLFWGAANGGQAGWRDMAISHALVTARDHVRADGSTYHVVNYDQRTGAVLTKSTHQGYADESTWARGQAWAIHGFTTTYRYTGDARFLATARSTADYFLDHLPDDNVPYWDFELPSVTGAPRDSSAAAIAASGLVELSRLEPDATRRTRYLDAATDVLTSLSAPPYRSDGVATEALLLHGTQDGRRGNVDTGLVYGDYYFLEALRRYESVVRP